MSKSPSSITVCCAEEGNDVCIHFNFMKLREGIMYYVNQLVATSFQNVTIKGAVNYCHLIGTAIVSIFLLLVTKCIHLCQPIGIQRQPLSLSNNNSLLLSLPNNEDNLKTDQNDWKNGENLKNYSKGAPLPIIQSWYICCSFILMNKRCFGNNVSFLIFYFLEFAVIFTAFYTNFISQHFPGNGAP